MPWSPKSHRPASAASPRPSRDIGSRARPGGEMLHSTRWRNARKVYLSANPLCVLCRDAGRITPATVVDHRKAHRGDAVLFWDQTNWRSLCSSCHGAKTCREDGGYGNRRK